MMMGRRPLLAAAVPLAALLACLLSPVAVQADKPEAIRSLTGSAGGSWYPLSVGMAKILGDADIKASVEIGGGNSNPVNISRGNGDIGITYAMVAALAAQGQKPFKAPITNIRGLFAIADNLIHMVVTQASGIKTIPDLKGRKVALQSTSAGATSIFRMILRTYGMSEDDLKIVMRGGSTQSSSAVRDRRAHFYLAGGAPPDGTVAEVAVSLPIGLLPVDDQHFAELLKINPGFLRGELPGGVYKGVDNPIPAVNAPIFMIARDAMPEDHAYWIVKTLAENLADLRKIHRALANITPAKMANFGGAPMHPGAARYYKEAGVLK